MLTSFVWHDAMWTHHLLSPGVSRSFPWCRAASLIKATFGVLSFQRIIYNPAHRVVTFPLLRMGTCSEPDTCRSIPSSLASYDPPDPVSASLCFQKAVLPHQASPAEVTIAGGQWRLNGAQMSQGVSGTHRMCSERWELREPGISGLQGALISPIWEVLRRAWRVPLIALCHFVELLLCKASRANCLSGTASYVLIVLVAILVPFWNYSSAFWSLT